ncbi:MAG: MqnA/MqnD/SBP family protein [Vampirovibrionales bacterium]|nr:MqnA/MqnD/SBP family protein [Vampirovibrionales bacterium]
MTLTYPHPIRVAHSPDADDAFMFYAARSGKVDLEGLVFEDELKDIESLNQACFEGTYDLTAISYAAYPFVKEHYRLLSVGSSVGDKYGPVLVAKREMTQDELRSAKIGVPGLKTSAYLALRLWDNDLKPENLIVTPFDQILEKVQSGELDAGVIIHEGQLYFAKSGLTRIVDLGVWWFELTNLVLPLGGNAVKRSLPEDVQMAVGRVLQRSIAWALETPEQRKEALNYALQYARDLDPALADRFVGMYVNDYTLYGGPPVTRAVKLMLWMGQGIGVIPEKIVPDVLEIGEPAQNACCAKA